MIVSLVCISLLTVLCLVLAIAVTIARGKYNILAGEPYEPQHMLYKLVRAHGNTIEFAPILALLIYILGQSPQPAWVLWCMALVTASRYLLVAGMIFPATLAVPNPMRFVGALGTYGFGLALCAALFLQALAAYSINVS